MCKNCMNQGCKYRFSDINESSSQFVPDYDFEDENGDCDYVCLKYQPDSDDGEYLYFDDEWNAPEIKQ